MAKKPKPQGKKYNYMDTYGDLVTLLLCFFVLLFAMSTVEETKYNAFAQALVAQMGPTPANASPARTPADQLSQSEPAEADQANDSQDNPTGDMMAADQTLPQDFTQISQAIEKYVAENQLEGSVSVEAGESGATFIRIQDNLLFGGNSSTLQPQALEFLDFLGACFVEVQGQIFRANFIGHTAAIDGSQVDDWVLACERSGTVASYFERTVGFSTGKMETTGYGRHYPIADNQTDEGRARNRRVDIVVVSNNTDTLLQALAEASNIYFPGDSIEFYEGSPADLPEHTLNNLPPVANLNGLTDDQVDDVRTTLDDVRVSNEDS